MDLILHLTGPIGEARRREIQSLLNVLRVDNMYWIAAQMNRAEQGKGPMPPTSARAAGVAYRPPTAAEAKTADHHFWGAPHLLKPRLHRPSGQTLKHGSCCDIAAYDAAAITMFKKLPTQVMVPRSGAPGVSSYHANIMTPYGPADPTIDRKGYVHFNYRGRR